MKYCKFCGKELDDEANFCPYCMKKQFSPTVIQPPKTNKSHKKSLIVLCCVLGVILIGFAVVGVIIMGNESKPVSSDNAAKQTSLSGNTAEQTTSAAEDSPDLNGYVGNWYSIDSKTGKAFTDIPDSGGVTLVILSAKEDVIRFSMTVVGSKPAYRQSSIRNIAVKIVDGVGSFSFTDDSWGNSGIGKIKLEKGRIYIETEVTKANEQAMFSIQTQCYLLSDADRIVDLAKRYDRILLRNFNEIKDNFGEEKYERETDGESGYTVYRYDELKFYVDDKNVVKEFRIDYNDTLSDDYIYEYNGVNSRSTYDDVISKMGEPEYNGLGYEGADGEVGYGINGGYLKFLIDGDLKVKSIYAFVQEEP